MKKSWLILFLLLLFYKELVAQDFHLVAASKEKSKDKNLLGHYTVSYDNYAESELFIYKGGKFVYLSHTDLVKYVSTGWWLNKGDTLDIKSEFGKGHLPISVSYLQRSTSDSTTRKFSIIKDLTGREYTHAAIHVNNDSVSCFWGDMECFGSYQSIDSVQIAFSDELYSKWFLVDSTKGIIQLTVQTELDLNLYSPLYIRFKKGKGKLKYIAD